MVAFGTGTIGVIPTGYLDDGTVGPQVACADDAGSRRMPAAEEPVLT